MATICTAECEKCVYCELTLRRKDGKKILMVHCNKHDKEYCYGQRIECEDKEKKRSED